MASVFEQRRAWVYNEFANQTEGTSMPNKKKTKLLKKLWRRAKREIK